MNCQSTHFSKFGIGILDMSGFSNNRMGDYEMENSSWNNVHFLIGLVYFFVVLAIPYSLIFVTKKKDEEKIEEKKIKEIKQAEEAANKKQIVYMEDDDDEA